MLKRFKRRITTVISAVATVLMCFQSLSATVSASDDIIEVNSSSTMPVDQSSDSTTNSVYSVNNTVPDVGSIVSFGYMKCFTSDNGTELWIPADTPIYLIETRPTFLLKKYRIYVPDITTNEEEVFFFNVEDFDQDICTLRIESENDGLFLGDLAKDSRINCFDMVLMRRALFSDNLSSEEKALADLNGDAEVSIADAVIMQNFILARVENFYE